MRTSIVVRILFGLVLCLLFALQAYAHPGSGIVVNKQGEIFFTDTGRGVWKIDRQGKLTYLPASRFHWMALDEAGSFAGSRKSFGEWFERVSPENSIPIIITCSDFPCTIGRDGNLYYADTRPAAPRIIRRTPDGSESIVAVGEMFQDVSGIAPGPDGSLYITDAGRPDASVIRKIAMDGTISAIAKVHVSKSGTGNPPPETEVSHCRGLVVDSSGVTYVAATGSRAVLRITPQGKVSGILQSEGSWSPTGVTLFEGEVYVLEWSDSPASQTEVREAWVPRVRKIGRDGMITTLATVSR